MRAELIHGLLTHRDKTGTIMCTFGEILEFLQKLGNLIFPSNRVTTDQRNVAMDGIGQK